MSEAAEACLVKHPGRASRPKTFIDVHSKENSLAGYLGFHHTEDLRRLIFSWPCLKAILAFLPISKMVEKAHPFQYILQSEKDYQNMADPRALYSQLSSSSHYSYQEDRYHHTAWILVHMRDDIEAHGKDSSAPNQKKTAEFRKKAQGRISSRYYSVWEVLESWFDCFARANRKV